MLLFHTILLKPAKSLFSHILRLSLRLSSDRYAAGLGFTPLSIKSNLLEQPTGQSKLAQVKRINCNEVQSALKWLLMEQSKQT